MALCAASQEAPFARVAGVQLRGSRCGLRSVALAAPKRLTFSRVAFGQSGGVQSKKGSATASAKMTGEFGCTLRRRPNGDAFMITYSM